jgi:hypothetical protein
MYPTLYEIVDESMMVECNFNYDSYQPFTKDDISYKVFLNMPIKDEQMLLIAENKQNPKWYFRRIPSIAQTEEGLGVKVEDFERYVSETINAKYLIKPKDIKQEFKKTTDNLY